MLQRDRGPPAESLRRRWYQARGHKLQYGSAVRGSGGAAGLVRRSLGRLPHCGFLSFPSPAPASVIGANLPSRPSPSGERSVDLGSTPFAVLPSSAGLSRILFSGSPFC